MFVRLNTDLPKDPSYPHNLKELGYMVTTSGEFVKISDPHGPNKHFTFYVTDNERANEVRKEAMHIAVRGEINAELLGWGIETLRFGGEKGDKFIPPGGVQYTVDGKKRSRKHVSIMTTGRYWLKQKKDVIIIIGEHNQDPGIWAYRSLMREGGIDGATVVGMFKKLQVLDMMSDRPPTVAKRGVNASGYESDDSQKTLVNENPMDDIDKDGAEIAAIDTRVNNIPGIIILNPGQLLFSHAEGKPMTMATWKARPRANALAPAYAIDEVHNRVPGHTTPDEHIATCFDSIIPRLVDPDAKLYVLGVTDGADSFIKWLDSRGPKGHPVSSRIWAEALLEPGYDHDSLHDRTKAHLSVAGRGWIKSSRPLGAFINSPTATDTFDPEHMDDETRMKEERKALKAQVREEAADLDDKEYVVVNAPSSASAKSSPSKINILDSPAKSEINTATEARSEMRALERSIQEFKLREEEDEGGLLLGLSDYIDAETRAAAAIPITSADSDLEEEETDEEWMEGSYDYTSRTVSFPTFSGGEAEYDELLLVKAMDKVLDWFDRRAESDKEC